MWKYVGVNVDGIQGVPTRDLTDEEFVEYSGKLNERHPDQLNSLKNSGLYEFEEDEKPSRSRRSQPDEVAPLSSDVAKTDETVTSNEGGESN